MTVSRGYDCLENSVRSLSRLLLYLGVYAPLQQLMFAHLGSYLSELLEWMSHAMAYTSATDIAIS